MIVLCVLRVFLAALVPLWYYRYVTDSISLDANVVASAFGKLTRPACREGMEKADIARAVLLMIASNIGTIAWLHAKQLDTMASRVIFCGSFLNNNSLAQRTLS